MTDLFYSDFDMDPDETESSIEIKKKFRAKMLKMQARRHKKKTEREKLDKWVSDIRNTKLQLGTKLDYSNYALWLRDVEPFMSALNCGHIIFCCSKVEEG